MRAFLAFVAAAGIPAAALAYPEGAPWGHAGVEGGLDCTDCHFQWDAVEASETIRLDGLPARYEAGERYTLLLNLAEPGAANGFQMAATSAGGAAGGFAPCDETTEANGAAVRSVETGDSWTVTWQAPETASGPVRFWIAVNAGNDDASEFGDRIHLRSFEIEG